MMYRNKSVSVSRIPFLTQEIKCVEFCALKILFQQVNLIIKKVNAFAMLMLNGTVKRYNVHVYKALSITLIHRVVFYLY